jgi:hypothetical protein
MVLLGTRWSYTHVVMVLESDGYGVTASTPFAWRNTKGRSIFMLEEEKGARPARLHMYIALLKMLFSIDDGVTVMVLHRNGHDVSE